MLDTQRKTLHLLKMQGFYCCLWGTKKMFFRFRRWELNSHCLQDDSKINIIFLIIQWGYEGVPFRHRSSDRKVFRFQSLFYTFSVRFEFENGYFTTRINTRLTTKTPLLPKPWGFRFRWCFHLLLNLNKNATL